MRISWSDPSLGDLRSLRAYIAKDNETAANRQVERILVAVSGLTDFPESGRPGRRSGTRELVVGRTRYLVAYRLNGDRIEILRVLHSRQRWPDTF
ncbi:MAG TPA: type II toxin-antitoxin system RelE/ParE family toxin [Alphaproteobacteria bacterium]|jgi:addiction module RelE/StbE family toxin|nr:type II toxin-antitoxin system RelE/ParE family toxin [Alphaproteobacteria bacterium]